MAEAPPASTARHEARSAVTLALLFTDIEGSTRRWEESPEAMRTALARHDALMRTAIGAAGGRVFKTVGDAFCAAFPDAGAAIAAALAAQRALRADGFAEVGGLDVRMAVHAGAVEARDDDYFGQPLNRIARLLAAAHGGQVLVSGVAADLAWGALPPQAGLRDLGLHRLRDLAQPEQVHQLAAPGLAEAFPPLRSLSGIPNNLPQQVTAFIGREAELSEIKALLERHRLVTLVGAGGIGKTRVSLQVGADLLERYADGVWLVELAPLADPQLIAETVAGIFGFAIAAGRIPADAVVAFLKPKRTLLILDNCEHLVAAVAGLADAILRACPGVAILASSREPLAIAGESTYRMPSLGFPEVTEGITAEAALAYGAVRLFAERAAAAVPGFVVANDNASAVAAICRRLDGVALAIELAAPRLNMLTPQELANRLHDRFRILTGGSRTALPRQQTLRALIDWSYNLLGEEERTLLRRLSVFAGGWTVDSAAAVAAGAPVDAWAMFDLLASLVDKSLVVAELGPGGTRYRLLESTRQYALEKLAETGDTGRRRTLAAYVLGFYREAEAAWPRTGTRAWLDAWAPELDNLRAGLDWAFAPDGDAALGLELAANALHLMLELNLLPERARWFDAATARIDAQTPAAVAARLWLGTTYSYNQFNDPPGAEPAKRAAALYRESGEAEGEGVALARAGAFLMSNRRTAESIPLLERALALLQSLGRSKHLAMCLHYRGVRHFFEGEHAAARACIEEAAAMARSLADRPGLNIMLNSLAEVTFGAGDARGAVDTIGEVIADAERDNDRRTLAHARSNLAAYSIPLGRIEEARDAAKQGLRDARALGLSGYVATATEHLALIAGLTGQPSVAARLLGYGNAWYARRRTVRQDTEQAGCDRLTARLATALADETRARLMAEGAAWSEDEAAEAALAV